MLRVFLAVLLTLSCRAGAEPLQKFEGCKLVATEWADGDSFAVLLPDGRQQTVRLYGADCIEIHVTGDPSNANRLRDQRRYFGIEDILVAKQMGELAKTETGRVLAQPFTVQTAFSDARGDGRFSRVYGFITTADGKDLSSWLVRQGLARAFGVVRQHPDGTSGNEWREQLADLELTAARAGRGAWAKTDWDKLPAVRKEARDEAAELEMAKDGVKPNEERPLDVNTAARDELMKLPGIGEQMAVRIIEGRPFGSLEDLGRIDGIGPKTLAKLRPFLMVAKR